MSSLNRQSALPLVYTSRLPDSVGARALRSRRAEPRNGNEKRLARIPSEIFSLSHIGCGAGQQAV